MMAGPCLNSVAKKMRLPCGSLRTSSDENDRGVLYRRRYRCNNVCEVGGR
jgi:hypothetical protein